ncbi:MAG TPA: hypothetical protein DDW77_00945 [Verrucomicrobiales bacterium]|nr:hypothetical protein [Verrucomicrobiales bacterium]
MTIEQSFFIHSFLSESDGEHAIRVGWQCKVHADPQDGAQGTGNRIKASGLPWNRSTIEPWMHGGTPPHG